MAWVKVPPENHAVFHAALPKDARVHTVKMFGGVAATVNGNLFAALFGLSTMIWLPEAERAAALAMPGATPFDPMGRHMRSDKVMLPERVMTEPAELRRWIARAFEGAAQLPPKANKPARAKEAAKNAAAKTAVSKAPAKKRAK
jgi:TfoX/Sxy family transcriptional regulator of competence genes